MARTGARAPAPTFPIAFDEADVRRLCGAAAFSRGDAIQRAGQVLGPTLGEGSMTAEVLGTFRRVDLTTVSAARGQLESSCTCGEGRLCRHAAALLLHWLRESRSFAVAREPNQAEEPSDAEESDEPETPVTELAQLLNGYSMTQLRTIARRRGARTAAKTKNELIQQLAPALAGPESVDAALAGLGDDERIVLDAVDLLGSAGRATDSSVVSAYAALGGAKGANRRVGETLNALVDLGLVIREVSNVYHTTSYTAPRAVSARLPTRDDLVHVLEAGPGHPEAPNGYPPEGHQEGTRHPGEVSRRPRLSMIQTFQVIAHELTEGGMQPQPMEMTEAELRYLPPGWRIHPKERAEQQIYNPNRESRLTPLPPLLSSADLHRLGKLTGQSPRMLGFALSLMASLGLLRSARTAGGFSLFIREDQLWRLLTLPPAEQLDLMVSTWLAMPDSIELGMVVHQDGALQLRFKPTYWSLPEPRGALVRSLVARLIGRLPRGDGSRWYDFSSLLDLLWHLAPALLSVDKDYAGTPSGYPAWRFIDSRQSNRPLNLNARDDWQRVWSPLVGTILAGPMRWLGLVETATAPDITQKGTQRVPGALAHDPGTLWVPLWLPFRVEASAAILAGRDEDIPAPVLDGRQPHLSISIDPEDGAPLVVVPSGPMAPAAGTRWVTLLPRLGELAGASGEGLRYRITADRVQMAFDDGLTGPQLLELLTVYSGAELPDEVRRTFEEWWSGYGRVRLYDELTLIELGDDLLLRELSATTSLEGAVIHAFSPRLIAVDPTRVEDLVAELTRIGHTPRVVEEP